MVDNTCFPNSVWEPTSWKLRFLNPNVHGAEACAANGVSRTCVPKRSLGTRDTRYRTAGLSASLLDSHKHALEIHHIRELLPGQRNDAVVGGGARFVEAVDGGAVLAIHAPGVIEADL